MNRKLAAVVACLFAWFIATREMCAQIKPALNDDYTHTEFEWAAFIHARTSSNFLNYPQSRLHPMTKVSVTLRPTPGAQTVMYEYFWYKDGKPIGMHRLQQPQFIESRQGGIVLGGDTDSTSSARAAANALVRVLLDMQLRKMNTTAVIVPQAQFGTVVDELARYGFAALDDPPTDGAQFSVTLRSEPYDLEKRLYLKH